MYIALLCTVFQDAQKDRPCSYGQGRSSKILLLLFIGGYLIQSEIAGILPATFFFQFTGYDQLPQSTLNGTVAERRAKLADILLIEPPDSKCEQGLISQKELETWLKESK